MVTSTIATAAATGEENYVSPFSQKTSIKPVLTFKYEVSTGADGIKQITESKAFQDFLVKNEIDPTDYLMKLVSPESTDNNLIMLTDGTNKWYYKISNEPIQKDGQHILRDTPNAFTLHNNCRHTVYYVGVILYRFISGWPPIWVQRIYRWDLPAGEVLNYRPGPDFTHVTINFTPNKGWRDHPIYCIPLGSWHDAYMFHDGKNYGWKW
jgi:hypothetical protein